MDQNQPILKKRKKEQQLEERAALRNLQEESARWRNEYGNAITELIQTRTKVAEKTKEELVKRFEELKREPVIEEDKEWSRKIWELRQQILRQQELEKDVAQIEKESKEKFANEVSFYDDMGKKLLKAFSIL